MRHHVHVVDGTTRFGGRSAARRFLLGVGLFWGGFLLVLLIAPRGREQSAPSFLIWPIAAATLAGGVLVVRGQRVLHRSLTGTSTRFPSLYTQIRSLLPVTMREASTEAGLNVTLVLIVLYGLLALDVASFFILSV